MAPVAAKGSMGILDRVWDFILKQFSRQPAWLRSVVYFIFVVFFLATAARLISGKYVVTGVIWDGSRYAQNCEVRVNRDLFGANSNGVYYAVLTPIQYYRLLLTRKADLPLVRSGQDGGRYSVSFDPVSDEFDDIHLPGASHAASPATSLRQEPFSILPAAYAVVMPPPPSQSERLFLEELNLANAATNVRNAAFSCHLNEHNVPLLAVGGATGELPVRAGAPLMLGLGYYFSVPESSAGSAADVELESDTGILSSYKEHFKFSVPAQYSEIHVSGDLGSTMVLRVMSRHDLSIYRRPDIFPLIERLRELFQRIGIRVMDHVPLTTAPIITDTLIVGPGVPYRLVQRTLAILAAEHVALRDIEFNVARSGSAGDMLLASTGSRNPVLTSAQLNQIIDASTEQEFNTVAGLYTKHNFGV